MKTAKMFVYVLVLAAMLLSACGGAATQAPAGGEQPAASGEKVNLVYWSMWNKTEPSAIALTEIINKFQAANPNITITSVWNGRENQTKVRTALGANTVIDVVDQDASQIAGGMMQEGLLLPIDEMLGTTALDESVPFKDVFVPGVLDVYVKDGVRYLMPYDVSPVMFWYNKDIFEKAGIAAPPATWDEFLVDLQKIKDAGFEPLAIEADGGDYNMFYFQYLVERMKGKGYLFKAIEDKTGEAWKDPVFTDALTMIKELWDKEYIPKASKGYQWPAAQQTVATGKTAMELVGGWLPNELSPITGPDFKWGGFNFPAVSGGVGKNTDLQQWLLAMGILKSSAHPKEAQEFLKFVMTKESQQTLANALQGVVRKGVNWPEAMADGAKASVDATLVLDHADGGTALQAEFTKNVLFANVLPVFLGDEAIADFPETMSSAAKNYWANK
jgi:ABC-type glycerol-3-phosphate transport system substrate-binding protein